MPLPKLETPNYTIVLPVSKEEVEFRPFLVREEKILLIAQESSDSKDMLRAVLRVLRACTFEKLKVEDLCMCDFEYLFLHIRAKSVGETTKIKLKCEKDDHYTPVEVNLTEIDVSIPENVNDTIQLNSTVGIKLRPIRVADAGKIDEKNKAEALTEMVRASTEYIFDNDNTYPIDNVTKKEFDEFVSSMSHKNLEDIQEYIENQPGVSMKVKFECGLCGHENEVELRGIAAFFE